MNNEERRNKQEINEEMRNKQARNKTISVIRSFLFVTPNVTLKSTLHQ
jgi:hypothetical protein